MPDILITTQRGTSNNPSMQFTGSALANIKMEVLPSGSIAFIGTSGSLFSITDNLIGSLMSVGDVSGLPILEVFSDDRIVMGKYNKNTLYVSGTNVGVGKVPSSAVLDVSGSVAISGSLTMSGSGVTFTNRGTTSMYGVVNSFGTSTAFNIYGTLSTNIGAGSGNASVDIGVGRSADGNAYLNFVSENAGGTYPFYGLLIAKLSGASGKSQLIHRGTGDFEIKANEAAAISLQTSGTEKVRILSGGDVGIGTTSPVGRLGIQSAAATNAYIEVAGNGNTLGSTSMLFGQNSTSVGYCWNRANANLLFGTNGTERMCILAAGNVGIGTASPAAKLDLYNATDLGSGANGIRVQRPGSYGQYGYLEYLYGSDQTVLGSIYTGNGANVYGQIYFRQHSSTTARDVMAINSSGNVGIGTTAPFYKIGINTSSAAGLYGNSIAWHQHNNDSPFVGISFDDTNDGLSFNASVGIAGFNRQYMFINRTTGNVGIGTTSPQGALTVKNTNDDAFILLGNNTQMTGSFGSIKASYNGNITTYKVAAAIDFIRNESSDGRGGDIYLKTNAVGEAGATTKMVVNGAGNVGIGTTSPTGRLQIHNASGNTIALYKDAGGAALALGSTTGPTDYALIESINGGGVRFYTGNGTVTEKVRIDVNGNVGIGKSTPNSVLDINGNTTITGSLTMSGTGAYPIYANGSYGVLMMYSGTNYGTIVGTNSGMSVNSTQTTDLNLGTAGSANITIKYGGNVGIGKSTPNSVLDINGNTIVTGSLSVVGAITATGNITAYFSDDRLKNNLGNIPDSLNKVLSLNGFYFEPNQTAIDLGYTKQKEVGVSAQQVQAILPEIIAAAPIDPMYMTVRYEKLIPLLIEAIKEQNSMIVDLQQKINRL